jgi:diguanylate cyclase (GGDEF)-like protein
VGHIGRLELEDLLVFGSSIIGVSCLSVASAANRMRLENREQKLTEDLAVQAMTDSLTGCLNHRGFHSQLQVEIDRARRYGRPLCMAMIDVDNFKSVNDRFGHQTGDNILAAIGASLTQLCRSSDVVGRVGGDEFAVVLPETELSAVVSFARRLTQVNQHLLDGMLSFSIGVAQLNRGEPSSFNLLHDADAALYEVKRNGRDGIAFFDDSELVFTRTA